jgi:hypothetical protein
MPTEQESASESTKPEVQLAQGHREPSGDAGPAKGQQNTRRFVFRAWSDMDDHELCQYALVALPERTPVIGRTGLAVPRWTVVGRREGRILICNRVHDRDCEWPWDVQAG